uniref:Uncharacterized protein n=1 Tax=Knipowitschia caucasica TaxID=637954 RepID=A0AAV2JJI3_KNICA
MRHTLSDIHVTKAAPCTCAPACLDTTTEHGKEDTKVQRGLTPFLEPSLSYDGDIAHGSFTPSVMPLHACSTEREGEEGGGSPSLRVTLPPFFLSLLFGGSRSLSLRACTPTDSVCAFDACLLLPVVAYLVASLFLGLPLPCHLLLCPSPDLPPQ